MNTPKEYTLDCARWRCGEDLGFGNVQQIDNSLGRGETALLNKEGYMCCLGQFAEQAGVALERLFAGDPEELAFNSEGCYDENFVYLDSVEDQLSYFRHTDLAEDAMIINDDPSTNPVEKIDQLRERLRREGITLNVINEEVLDKWKSKHIRS